MQRVGVRPVAALASRLGELGSLLRVVLGDRVATCGASRLRSVDKGTGRSTSAMLGPQLDLRLAMPALPGAPARIPPELLAVDLSSSKLFGQSLGLENTDEGGFLPLFSVANLASALRAFLHGAVL